MKKNFAIAFLLLSSYSSFSQKIVGLGGIGLYLNTTFENNSYFSANLGVEYNITNYLKPEVKVEYFLGALPQISTFNDQFVETELFNRNVSAITVSFSPKVNLSPKEQAVQFQIIPMYNFTTVSAEANIFTLDTTQNLYVRTDEESISEVQHSLGIGVGVLLKIDSETYQAIAFELNYNNIDLGKAFTKIDFNQDAFHTNQSLGLRIKYYFGFSKNKK